MANIWHLLLVPLSRGWCPLAKPRSGDEVGTGPRVQFRLLRLDCDRGYDRSAVSIRPTDGNDEIRPILGGRGPRPAPHYRRPRLPDPWARSHSARWLHHRDEASIHMGYPHPPRRPRRPCLRFEARAATGSTLWLVRGARRLDCD